MPSTYTTNLGIEKPEPGEQEGQWGDTVNTNYDMFDEAINGVISVTLSTIGTSGSPNDLPITDGASSEGRNAHITLIDGGDLGGTAFVQLTPNNAEKLVYITNSLSASQSVNIFQGTYNASNDITLANGKTALLKFDGAGTGAVVTEVITVTSFEIGALTPTDSNVIVGDGTSWVAESGATARTSLGLAIGTDVQAWDTQLDDIAALTPTDSNIIVGDGANWVAESGATARTSLGLTIGTNVQAWDTQLDDIAALAVTDGNIIVGDGANWVAESGATARTSLGAQAQGDVLDDLNTLGANAADSEVLVGTGAGALAWESGATARTSLGVAIGTDVQAFGAVLDDFNTLGAAASDGEFIVATGAGAFSYESGATARTSLGVSIGSDVQAYDAGLADIAGLAVTDGNIIVGDGVNWVAESGATARTSLGVAIGTDVQAQGDVLDDINTLGANSADSEFLVGTGAGALAWESGATARTSLGVAIGTDVQAQGAVLDDFNTLGAASTDGEIIVATGAGTFAYESGATARTSLGLGIGTDVQAYDADNVTGPGSSTDNTLARFHETTGDIIQGSGVIIDDNDQVSMAGNLTSVRTGTSETVALTDAGRTLTFNNASAITFTIPANASVAFPVGTFFDIVQLGAGQVSVAITTDTLRSKSSYVKLTGQYSGATIKKIAATEWIMVGDLAA